MDRFYSHGFVYVGDFGENNNIQKFDSDGNFILNWGSPGSADGQFTNPADIAIDSQGVVYVVDNGNDRIQVFDNNGNFITKWGSRGPAEGQFNNPVGVAVGSDGRVYVTDEGNARVQVFSSGGGG